MCVCAFLVYYVKIARLFSIPTFNALFEIIIMEVDFYFFLSGKLETKEKGNQDTFFF